MVDTTAQIHAVTRAVRTSERDGDELHVQSLTQTYPSPLDDVWEATTTAERIVRWFAPVEGDLRLGGRYQVVGNAGGTVEECTPPRDGAAGYRITWEFGGGVSWVEVAVRAEDADHTTLTLTHIARASDVPPGFWETYGPGATGVGWDLGLLGLAQHLSRDASIPPEQGEAWMLGPEGLAFSRASADAWADAHIADGGEPDAARRSADATFAFFTGQGAPGGDAAAQAPSAS